MLKGTPPDCQRSKCKIGESLATDFEVNAIVEGYLLAKRLPLGEKCPALTFKILDEVGLVDNPKVLIALEATYHEEQRKENQSKEIKQKQNTFLKRKR